MPEPRPTAEEERMAQCQNPVLLRKKNVSMPKLLREKGKAQCQNPALLREAFSKSPAVMELLTIVIAILKNICEAFYKSRHNVEALL